MKHTTQLIGLHDFARYIDMICQNPAAYARMTPAPVLVYLAPGSGRTTAVRYAAEMLREHGILAFCAREPYLELTVDGTAAKQDCAADALGRGAGFVNCYDGVAALDLTPLCGHLTEGRTADFLDVLADAAEHALLVLFLDERTARTERMAARLAAVLPGLACVEPAPYTPAELAEILGLRLADKGVAADETALQAAVRQAGAATVPQLKTAEKQLLLAVDYTAPQPILRGVAPAADTEKVRENHV